MGVVLYEMLAGKRPFRGGTDQAVIHAILNDEPIPIEEHLPGVGPAVVALLQRALRKDVAQRYADMESLLRDVTRLVADPEGRGDLEALPSVPPEGERRLVVVAACPITGFESLLDQAEAEGVAHLVDVRHGDALDANFDEATVVFLFLPPGTISRLLPNLLGSLPRKGRVVAHEQSRLETSPPPQLSKPLFGSAAITVAHRWARD